MRSAALIMLSAPLAACVATAAPEVLAVGTKAPIRVMRPDGKPFAYDEGVAARLQADALCGGKVRSSTYDRYDAGAWVFVEGCA